MLGFFMNVDSLAWLLTLLLTGSWQISMKTTYKDLNGLVLAASACGAVARSFFSCAWCDSGY